MYTNNLYALYKYLPSDVVIIRADLSSRIMQQYLILTNRVLQQANDN